MVDVGWVRDAGSRCLPSLDNLRGYSRSTNCTTIDAAETRSIDAGEPGEKSAIAVGLDKMKPRRTRKAGIEIG